MPHFKDQKQPFRMFRITKLLISFLFVCSVNHAFGQELSQDKAKLKEYFERIDTLIERNNPNALDLGRHQLYIDTTKTSLFYEWNPFLSNELFSISEQYLNDLYGSRKVEVFDFGDLPRLWFTLRRYKGEYILHKRCDGQEKAIYFSDSLMYLFTVELTLRKIKELKIKGDGEIQMEFERFKDDQDKTSLFVKIRKTERKDVFMVTTNESGEELTTFMTTNYYLRNFDLLINHCPIEKVHEFDDKFDL